MTEFFSVISKKIRSITVKVNPGPALLANNQPWVVFVKGSQGNCSRGLRLKLRLRAEPCKWQAPTTDSNPQASAPASRAPNHQTRCTSQSISADTTIGEDDGTCSSE